jgi:hypothetical protein
MTHVKVIILRLRIGSVPVWEESRKEPKEGMEK